MRRLLAAVGLLVLLGAPVAAAQASGYQGQWTDPASSAGQDGTPLARIDAQQTLTGQVSHPNGISRVDAVIVPDSDNPPPAGCDPSMDPLTAEGSGSTTVTFHVPVRFPCNLVYHVKATAKANAANPVSPPPPAYQLPLDVAVAIPPAAVTKVTATVAADGEDRAVGLDWPANHEPDLLGYVITRVTGSNTTTLGQVKVGDPTRYTDDDPPSGRSSTYEITAVRRGPDDEVKQVAATPTTVTVDVPSRSGSGGGSSGSAGGSGAPEGKLTTVVTGQASTGRPDPGSLSSVRARAGDGTRPTPPTTLDSGFQETLPFKPGESAAGAPKGGDDAVVAVFDEGGSDGGLLKNKPTLTFIAGGLAVLVGAAVLFYVTRRAALDAY